MRKLTPLIAVVAFVFAAFALAGCAAPKAEVPDLTYMDQAEAEQALTSAGLKLGNVTERADDGLKVGGFVLSQSQEAGSSVDQGTAVDIVVSSGPSMDDPVEVPDLKGMSPDEAEQALLNVMLVPQRGESKYSTKVEPGLVCAQSTKAGTQLKPLDTVTYSVSLGKEQVAVPNVVGMTSDDAAKALKSAKLTYDSTTTYNDSVAEGVVISQNVAADTKVDKGSVVAVEVSLGPKPAAKVAVPNIMTYSLGAAVSALESAGLKASYSGDEDGSVVWMGAAPGTEVDQGTTVEFQLKMPDMIDEADSGSGNAAQEVPNNLSKSDVEKVIWNEGLGDMVGAEKILEADNVWYWKVTCKDASNKSHTYYVDPNSNVSEV